MLIRSFAYMLAGLAIFSGVGLSQFIPGRYIVVLEAGSAAKTSAVQARAAQVAPRARVAAAGGRVRETLTATTNALIVDLPEGAAEQLASEPGIKTVVPVRRAKVSLEAAPSALGAENAWRNYGGAEKAGLGVRIGIIDTGVDAKHPAFQDASLTPPAGFPRADTLANQAFTNSKVIVARAYGDMYPATTKDKTPNDAFGHGTAVAMSAAGVIHDTPRGKASGMAPKAFIGNYRADDPDDPGSFDGDVVLKAFDDAVADGMNVINLSLGSSLAVRPELDEPYAGMVRDAVARGIIVVAAAGNDGPDPVTVSDYSQQPLVISVGASRHARISAASVIAGGSTLLAQPSSRTPETLADLTAPLFDVTSIDATSLACNSLPAGRLTGRIAVIMRGTCTFEVKILNAAAAGAQGVVIYTANAGDEPFSFTVTTATTPALMVSNADGQFLKGLAATNTPATLRFALRGSTQNHRLLAPFSGVGPGASYDIKPDLVSIGEDVYTAKTGGGYESINGTSFSSPIVAGTAAFLKSARPGLTTQQYRSMIINTAQWMEERLQQRGNGSLFIDEAANATITAAPTSVSFGISGVNTNVTRQLNIGNLGPAQDTFILSVFPLTAGPVPVLSASQLTLAAGASQSVNLTFAANGLPGGERNGIVIVRGTASGKQIFVPYWHGVPTNAPARISVLYQTESARVNGNALIYFRALDAAGMPAVLPVQPTVDAAGGAGSSIVRINNFNNISPGLIEAQVRLRNSAGNSTFTIHAPPAADVVITIEAKP